MGDGLSSCLSILLALVVLFALFVVWTVVDTRRENRRRHQEIQQWAERERQEREREELTRVAINGWQGITAWFPFLPLPEPASHSPDDLMQAAVRRLLSAPSLGTLSRYGIPAPSLPPAERRRHLYVVGKTGSGKTTYLEHLMLADLQAGHGVGVMAPEGELFRSRLLPLIPASRREDIIYFCPGDPACTLSFNPMQVEGGDDALRAAEDLFTIFKRALPKEDLGPRMQPILQNAFAALVGRPGVTLWDVKRLLTDSAFRGRVVGTTADPYIREFWELTFPRFAKGADLPLLSRLDHFLRPPAIRRALCHPVSSFSIRTAIREKQILLVDLFGLSEETRAIVGQMILSKFQIELMRRELSGGVPATFFLYCDEFQTFAGFAEGVWRELLSRGRKYGLALTLAHQFPAQLPTALQEEIFGNVNSMVAFALGSKDAQTVRKELLTDVERKGEMQTEPLPVEELLDLRVGDAYAKLAGGRAVKISMPSPLQIERRAAGEELIAHSWARYAAPRLREEETPPVQEQVPTEKAVASVPPPQPVPSPGPTPPEPRAASRRAAPEPKPPGKPQTIGRGGPEHQYLQELVKRWGEAKGFRAIVEEQVLDGQGSVDVVLEREGWRIACEISIASTVEQEVGNVKKCLSAGFAEVVVISPNKRHLGKIEKALGKRLPEDALTRVRLLLPEEFSAYLDGLPVPIEKVETVGGYQVRVSYRPASVGDSQSRAKTVAGVIARSLRRMQGKAG
ncbi:MAG TPA: hypothetical protein VN493_06060 [Thermoanaerobaculia bacterium]|nr:hypothetical protein [Thermoanaerobaculia bacterium]